MTFDNPISFMEALRRVAAREVLPTNLGSAELREVARGIRERSIFSAKNTMESVLGEIKDQVTELLEGESNVATGRLKVKESLRKAGYEPDPDKRGTIEDLSSDQRIDQVLETNAEQMQGYGHWLEGQDESVLDQWPAQELFRAEAREQERDWLSRWRIAGEASGESSGWTFQGGRMVALKNHPIWEHLGDTSLFDDGLDNPWPPFAFGSGMDVRDVTREEAMELGLIDRDTVIAPEFRAIEGEVAA